MQGKPSQLLPSPAQQTPVVPGKFRGVGLGQALLMIARQYLRAQGPEPLRHLPGAGPKPV